MLNKFMVFRRFTMQGSRKRVQSTNDRSILSKHSMVKTGYFRDEFLKYFVTKDAKRSPLINRGYYIRMKAVNHMLHTFLTSKEIATKQVVSLGAGFDTSFFRFTSEGLLGDTKFFEVDFPEVVKQKASFIRQHHILTDITGQVSPLPNKALQGLCTEKYSLIGWDLKKLSGLEKALLNCGLDTGCPTLLLSEVVLSYLSPHCSSAVICWAARLFISAIFVTYEQVFPDDPFGIVMTNHFQQIGSPLRSITTFRTPEAQVQRYKEQGWPTVKYQDMNSFYNSLPAEERRRVETIEPFDEFEEWHLKCSHYVILAAFKGSCHVISNLLIPDTTDKLKENLSIDEVPKLNPMSLPIESGEKLRRYGHCAVALPSGEVIVTGGFGQHGTKHMRLPGVQMLCHSQGVWQCTEVLLDSGNVFGPRMFNTATLLDNNMILIHGGRTSPYKPCISTVLLSTPTTAVEDIITNNETIDITGQTNRALNEQGSGKETMKNSCSEVDNTSSNSQKKCCSICKGEPVKCRENCRKCTDAECATSTSVCTQNLTGHNGSIFDKQTVTSRTKSVDVINRSKADHPTERSEGGATRFTCGVTVLECKGTGPVPRWRHTATKVVYENGREAVLMFGGRTLTHPALNDCHLLDTNTFTWTELVLSGDPPDYRHSHTATLWRKHHVVLSGGLGVDSSPTSSLQVIDTKSLALRTLDVKPPLQARYSHTAHILNNNLMLIGGVSQNTTGYPNIVVVNLEFLTWKSYSLPVCPSPSPLMLHNHSSVYLGANSIMVLGGGGNCFSFGTHLNKDTVVVDVSLLVG